MTEQVVGKVFFVGAGPGDPKLITVRGMEALQMADAVVYDRLASPRLLRYLKPDTQKIYVGKLPDRHTLRQEEINQLLLELAQQGLTVTRLKGGDPAVFGRVGEEALTLAEQGVPFELVPGVTSAIAVPAYAGIPVTHRGLTSSFAIVTGHECPKKDDSDIDWQKLATATGTIIFLMGVKNLASICEQMIAHGRMPSTQVAVIQWGTCTAQRTVTGTLETIYQQVQASGISSPAITIVGEVVQLRDQLQWFERKPLFGRKIVVTRARKQASQLVARIEELGGEALELPVIETVDLTDAEDRANIAVTFEKLSNYEWILFTSVNGVESFFRELRLADIDIRTITGKIAAVGEKTATELAERGLQVELIPEDYRAEGLFEPLQAVKVADREQRVLLARAKVAREWLPQQLRELGFIVDDVAIYETRPVSQPDEYVIEQILSGEADAITFTSSSTVSNYLALMNRYDYRIPDDCKIICIGPITAQTAYDAGLQVTATSDQATIESLVQALLNDTRSE